VYQYCGAPRRQVTVPAADLLKLAEAVVKVKERFGMPNSARVVNGYEAGRDGLWLHRHVRNVGIGRYSCAMPPTTG